MLNFVLGVPHMMQNSTSVLCFHAFTHSPIGIPSLTLNFTLLHPNVIVIALNEELEFKGWNRVAKSPFHKFIWQKVHSLFYNLLEHFWIDIRTL